MIHQKPLRRFESERSLQAVASAQWLVRAVARRYERAEIAARHIGERSLVILFAPLRRRSRREIDAWA